MRFLGYVFMVLIVFAIAFWSVLNRQTVELNVLPDMAGIGGPAALTLAVPFFAVVIVAVAVGFALGTVREYLREMRHRSDLSKKRREAAELRHELAALKADSEDEDGLPALPAR